MSFDWADYLRLAEQLAENAPSNSLAEAMWRAAISRAYYAAFVSARNFLQDKEGFVPSSPGRVHTEVRAEFQNSPDVERQRIGSYLATLLTWRKKADYENEVSVPWEPQVELMLSFARRSLATLEQL